MTVETTTPSAPSAPPPAPDERAQVLDWVVGQAARLGSAGRAPLRRITVSTATLAVDVQWSCPPGTPAAGEEHPADHPAERQDRGREGAVLVTAPMVGTFYRAREPGAPPFVQVGDLVEAGQQVGVIEAMKLMNAVQAERAGRVSEIVAEDGAPVQYEDPLLALVPCDSH
ncbi:hypothetical protein Ssi03_04250 [Sphaerisporangium siamense]|uniref:Biotin carboxyl carrier protein of acetyl-CoA carboxylase n=1 Tax=Sphaerisporangium siamense TaxID=795645 RepID=A0A7W7DBV0_9ACTN|nr:biotin/lipoyl-containing protein [Sphaerisporangium siamense]MBB4703963.1 acetyl-CoA carboxylase biotin carboxyl carrier protein [Sphaerisporangium siamense]GII82435.1 hypothetical protein Ssi03_04250 [Sphaerisporangium siamense]